MEPTFYHQAIPVITENVDSDGTYYLVITKTRPTSILQMDQLKKKVKDPSFKKNDPTANTYVFFDFSN